MRRKRMRRPSRRGQKGTVAALVAVLMVLALLTYFRVPIILASAGIGWVLRMEFDAATRPLALALLDICLFGSLGMILSLSLVPDRNAPSYVKRFFSAISIGFLVSLAAITLDVRRLPAFSEVWLPLVSCICGFITAATIEQSDLWRRRLTRAAWLMILGSMGIVFWYVNTGLDRQLKAAVIDHIRDLRMVHQSHSNSDYELGKWLNAGFANARKRSGNGEAVLNNEAVILSLGFIIGHESMEEIIGIPISPDIHDWAKSVRGRTMLRGRKDWPRHFTVSSALRVISDQEVSDAIGHLKEEFDAVDGSGFSFSDLMANRAGILFAEAATRDEGSALAFQKRFETPISVDDYFPVASDLPEGISEAAFKSDYGGIKGRRYRELEGEIEARLKACKWIW